MCYVVRLFSLNFLLGGWVYDFEDVISGAEVVVVSGAEVVVVVVSGAEVVVVVVVSGAEVVVDVVVSGVWVVVVVVVVDVVVVCDKHPLSFLLITSVSIIALRITFWVHFWTFCTTATAWTAEFLTAFWISLIIFPILSL